MTIIELFKNKTVEEIAEVISSRIYADDGFYWKDHDCDVLDLFVPDWMFTADMPISSCKGCEYFKEPFDSDYETHCQLRNDIYGYDHNKIKCPRDLNPKEEFKKYYIELLQSEIKES